MNNPIYLMDESMQLPLPENAADDEGLVAVGGMLRIKRLKEAYSKGIFPWYEEGYPVLWWSPDPRMILYPPKLKVSKSLRSLLRKDYISVKFDTCFAEVITQCAKMQREGQQGTWITDDMKKAYIRFHSKGYAHSVETYYRGKLAGGLYGVSLGKMFFGESMFHLQADASKIALYYLCTALNDWNFHLIDVQVETAHMKRMGGELIERRQFITKLNEALTFPTKREKWTL